MNKTNPYTCTAAVDQAYGQNEPKKKTIETIIVSHKLQCGEDIFEDSTTRSSTTTSHRHFPEEAELLMLSLSWLEVVVLNYHLMKVYSTSIEVLSDYYHIHRKDIRPTLWGDTQLNSFSSRKFSLKTSPLHENANNTSTSFGDCGME